MIKIMTKNKKLTLEEKKKLSCEGCKMPPLFIVNFTDEDHDIYLCQDCFCESIQSEPEKLNSMQALYDEACRI